MSRHQSPRTAASLTSLEPDFSRPTKRRAAPAAPAIWASTCGKGNFDTIMKIFFSRCIYME